MASGMGMPSIGIYSHELFNVFGVETILRVGSAGALQEQGQARGHCPRPGRLHRQPLGGAVPPGRYLRPHRLLPGAGDGSSSGGEKQLPFHVGNLLSSDQFYGDDAGVPEALTANAGWKKMGVLAIEMEAAALYLNAARYGKQALAICTVSDHILTGEATTAQERQTSFTDMMRLALETARRLEAQP